MFAAVTPCGGADCDNPAGFIMRLLPGQRHCIGGSPSIGGENAHPVLRKIPGRLLWCLPDPQDARCTVFQDKATETMRRAVQ